MSKEDERLNFFVSSAINLLPRTLAGIGESLMNQTGWNVSILMGGPHPENGGTNMTYM